MVEGIELDARVARMERGLPVLGVGAVLRQRLHHSSDTLSGRHPFRDQDAAAALEEDLGERDLQPREKRGREEHVDVAENHARSQRQLVSLRSIPSTGTGSRKSGRSSGPV